MIGLYPNLLPQDFRRQLDYPEKLPDLEGSDLEKGLMALIDYLKDVSSLWILCEKSHLTFKKYMYGCRRFSELFLHSGLAIHVVC